MKKLIFVLVVLALLTIPSAVMAGGPSGCATIQSGTITDSVGNPVNVGYDQFGYDYQAHMFNGRYCDFDRVIGGDYCDVNLIMKWNDAWLSNKDCNGDGLLDRHYGFGNYIGSGAWLTNHQRGTGDAGDDWTYFVKIVAVPADATKTGEVWYAADGTKIGPSIWGSFAVLQRVDSGVGVYDLSPAGPGFGKWK